MFGKLLVGLVAALVVGVGGFLYLESQSCPDHIGPSCPSSNQSVSLTPAGDGDSCCGTISRSTSCCATTESEVASEEVLTVEPREVQ